VTEPSDRDDRLMSIGVFARRSRLSMRALRLYDRQGLLKPERVDTHNGYRWYRESQLFIARLIVMLRQLDMPLAEVAELVNAPRDRAAAVLTEYWSGVERRIAGQRQLVELLRAGLIDGERRYDTFSVNVREIEDQVVLAEQRHLTLLELEPWLRQTKITLTNAAEDCGGLVAPMFAIFHGEVSHDSDGPVEVCVPIPATDSRPAVATDRYWRTEPAHREAYVTVTKAQFEMPAILTAYDAIRHWIDSSHHAVAGSPREIYVPGVDPHNADPSDPVCDVAFPIGS
jgi:DNA-binding transcriptional MerR regulator